MLERVIRKFALNSFGASRRIVYARTTGTRGLQRVREGSEIGWFVDDDRLDATRRNAARDDGVRAARGDATEGESTRYFAVTRVREHGHRDGIKERESERLPVAGPHSRIAA